MQNKKNSSDTTVAKCSKLVALKIKSKYALFLAIGKYYLMWK